MSVQALLGGEEGKGLVAVTKRVIRDRFTYWYPAIWSGGLPTPISEWVPYDHFAAIAALEGDQPYELPETLSAAAERIGYPLFFRNDLTSAKHDGINGIRVEKPNLLARVLSGMLRMLS